MKTIKTLLIVSSLLVLAGCQKSPNDKNINVNVPTVIEENIQKKPDINNNVDNKTKETKTEKILQEITYADKKYRAYEDKITEVINSSENVIYKLHQKINTDAGEKIYFIDNNPNLKLSPSGNILFFDYFNGLSSCWTNGIQLDSNKLLWNDMVGCDAKIFWSSDNKQVAITWNHFDTLNLYISNFRDITKLVKKLEISYPSGDENIKLYWTTNNIFIFEPNEKIFNIIKDNFKDNNLKLGINEFVVR